jgi:glycosyltransferase involved in cell wall biosynthesis
MSVLNGSEYLPKVMGDILGQTFSDFEFIIVDDGSTDGSGEALDRYSERDDRIRVIHQENTGLCAALARGCALARGELIARMDVDDRTHPQRLARQVEYMSTQSDVVLCGTWAWQAGAGEGLDALLAPPDDHILLLGSLERGGNPFVHGGVMFRRNAYLALGEGYRITGYCEDFDLWLRLAERGRLGMVAEPMYVHFLTMSGMTFGAFAIEPQVKRLCLRLHAERMEGGESTNWRADLTHILSSAPAVTDPGERATEASYVRALRALRGRRWSEYRAALEETARGSGRRAVRARMLKRLGWAAPLVRLLLLWRLVRAGDLYSRPLPDGTRMPDWASA